MIFSSGFDRVMCTDIVIFLKKKRRKGYFLTDFLRIHLYIQKLKLIFKDLKTTW